MTTIAQATQPSPSLNVPPPSGPVEWSILVAVLAVVGRQAWQWFLHSDAAERDLTKTLINDLRTNQAQLVAGNREGFKEMVDATHDLKEAIGEMTRSVSQEVQTTLKSQTSIYASQNEILGKILMKVEALHGRLDRMEERWKEDDRS